MVTARQPETAVEWWLEIPDEVSGQLLIAVPEGFEITDQWWEALREDHSLLKLELTSQRELRITMATNEGASISAWVLHFITNWMLEGGDGAVFDSAGEFIVPAGRRKRPDGCWVSANRLPRTPRPWSGIFQLTPNLVLEVRSPSQSVADQQAKMNEWMQAGVRLGGLTDPFERKVWIYRESGAVEELDDPATLSGENVCEGLVVDMSRVW